MLTPEQLSAWIASQVESHLESIDKVYLFGSVARRSDAPGDCDIAIVAATLPGTPEWAALRTIKSILKDDFQEEFDLILSVTIFTQSEFNSLTYWFHMRGDPLMLIDLTMGTISIVSPS